MGSRGYFIFCIEGEIGSDGASRTKKYRRTPFACTPDLFFVQINSGSATYSYLYDLYGNVTDIKIGNQSLASYIYQAGNGTLQSVTYGNGFTLSYVYDELDRIIGICYNGNNRVAFRYSSKGEKTEVQDLQNDTVYTYYYDADGKLVSSRTKIDGVTVCATYNKYDTNERLKNHYIYYPNTNVISSTSTEYSYDDDGNVIKVSNYIGTEVYTYDSLGRLTTNTIKYGNNDIIKDTIIYNDSNTAISDRITRIKTEIGSKTENTLYTYDSRGNILSIGYQNTGKYIYYVYDNKDQITREDNEPLNTTFTYQYDSKGNIVSIGVYDYTRATNISSQTPRELYSYTYANNQWKDLLTSINHTYPATGSTSKQGNLTYDAIGNPLNYFNGKNSYVFTWQNGRQLATIKRGTSTVATFAYNQDGIRTSKICGNSKHEYYLDGNKVVREVETRVNNGNLIKDSQYFYDARGYISSATVLYYNSTGTSYTKYNFLFRTNMQGDVIEIYNTSGSLVMGITYDAWGNFTDTISSQDVPPTIEQAMALGLPFRYRSYYYDSETGFYYLNSRYYDPQIRRFISADNIDVINASPTELTDKNLYAYCDNNPIIRIDDGGEFWNFVIGAAVGGLIGGVVSAVKQLSENPDAWRSGKFWANVGVDVAVGAVNGLVCATGLGIVAQAATNGLVSGLGEAAHQLIDDGEINLKNVCKTTLTSTATSLIGGCIGKAFTKNITNFSNQQYTKAAEKAMIGFGRQASGKSSSAILRQSTKYLLRSRFAENVSRGISSVVGTLYGAVIQPIINM